MKTITITGVNNRYQIKKLLPTISTKTTKKQYEHIINEYPNINNNLYQFNIINDIFTKYKNTISDSNINEDDESVILHKPCDLTILTPIEKLIWNEIKTKLHNYKSQDICHKFNTPNNNIISIINCIELLVTSKIMCVYCLEPCLIIYENIRYPKQWTLDRVNNDMGHTVNNVIISCLQCNLQRKNKNSEKFKQGKQLKLVKIE